MKRILVTLSALALALSTVTAAAATTSPPDAETSRKGPGCSDVVVVHARGSGQSFDEEKNPDRVAADRVLRIMPRGISARAVEINYLASPMSVLRNDLRNGTLNYLTRAETGGTWITNFVRADNEVCKDTVYVFIGYSQGALAVHHALDRLRSSASIRDNIASIQLLGNPVREAPSFNNRGTAPNRSGGVYRRLLGPGFGMVDDFDDRLLDWCNAGDFVCSFNFRTLDAGNFNDTRHRTSYTNGRTTTADSAGTAAASAAAAAVRAQQ